MSAPRMRTAPGALEIIKELDPGTAVTLRYIRRLIATETVPHVDVGRKKLPESGPRLNRPRRTNENRR